MSIGKLAGTSIITAIAASLCCITPVLAFIAGSGSMAFSFSWLEPARPFRFDVSKTNIKDITDAINATGYTVTSHTFKK